MTEQFDGPWDAARGPVWGDLVRYVHDSKGRLVASCHWHPSDDSNFPRGQEAAEAHALLIASAPSMRAALAKATAWLILDRDCLYESITTSDGEIQDPQDREDLAQADALIDQCQAALGGLSRIAILEAAKDQP